MAKLPHFTNINSTIFNPIYTNRVSIDFNNKELDDNCKKIDGKYIYFHLSEISNEVIPLDNIFKLIETKKKFNISISILSKHGEIISIIYLQNATFIKLKNLIDFDYSTQAMASLTVKYKYEKMKIFKNTKHLFLYQRKEKIERLNSI